MPIRMRVIKPCDSTMTFRNLVREMLDALDQAPPPPVPEGFFRCASCDAVFKRARSIEEVMAEAEAEFGALLGDDPAEVCDDCYNLYRGVVLE